VTFMKFGGFVALALMLAGAPSPAFAQTTVSTADIQRLQDNIFDASRDVAQMRSRDSMLAEQLETQLDEARDETIYLKVKLRKNERVVRRDYSDLRDRVENIRSRARGVYASSAPSSGIETSRTPTTRTPTTSTGRTINGNEIPVGTEFDVRLQDSLTSDTAQVEDRFEATTMVDVQDNGRVIVPAGSVMRGVVSSVTKAGRIERKGSMTIAFDQITIRGRSYPMRATVTQALESEGIRGEAGTIGTGAGIGAIIGGILGGFKGALAGILIGAGGTVAATEGNDVELPAGTVLRVRMDSALNVNR
jgi:hypothetical protein